MFSAYNVQLSSFGPACAGLATYDLTIAPYIVSNFSSELCNIPQIYQT